MEKQSFLKRKDIEISAKRYFQDAMSAMASGLFASLLIGVIFDTLGVQTANLFGDNAISAFMIEIGGQAKAYMGAAIGIAVAWGLKSPPLVLFTCSVVGMMGANMMGFGIEYSGGPAGAFIAVILAAEFGKAVSKETKVDIIVTPAVTLIVGGIAAKLAGTYHDCYRMAAVPLRYSYRSISRTCAYSAYLKCGDLYHARTFRFGGRCGYSGMLCSDGRLRSGKL